jgi:3-oxoadipate enol-lactonase
MPRVFVNGRHFHYEEFGDGEPVVFVSGLGGDHRAFAVPQRALGKRYRALAYDNRDVGRSDRDPAGFNTGDLADDLAALLQSLGAAPAHVVGHSLGGLIAQQVALRYPEVVRSLVLASCHAGAEPWRKAVLGSWILLKHRTDAADFTRSTLPWLVAPGFYRNEASVEGLVRFAERNPWPQEPAAFERQALAAMGHETRSQLWAVRAPTLVMVGELDLVNPPRVARELVDLIQGARYLELPGVGHLPHIEDSGAFRDAVSSFLDGLP